MNPEAFRYIFVASIAGGFVGALVLWHRKRTQATGESRLRRRTVLTLGTAASTSALLAFGRAFGAESRAFAALAVILITGLVAVVNSVSRLPLPQRFLEVSAGEFGFLRAPWVGVRLFGTILRGTPLRHLGGRVFLPQAGRDPRPVMEGIRDAMTVHVWALACSIPWLAFCGLQGWWVSIVWGLAVHFPLNVFPVLHLRYVTRRMDGLMVKLRRKENADARS